MVRITFGSVWGLKRIPLKVGIIWSELLWEQVQYSRIYQNPFKICGTLGKNSCGWVWLEFVKVWIESSQNSFESRYSLVILPLVEFRIGSGLF